MTDDDARPPAPGERQAHGKPPITLSRITDAALEVVSREGYDALTMRRMAAVLDTGPASLYAHVSSKAGIDGLIIGRLCAELVLPEPDPATWREQIVDVCVKLRDQYLRYPGISRAALAMVDVNEDVLRVSEGMLAILLAGGIDPQTAAWTIDALALYVGAYALEVSVAAQRRNRRDDTRIFSREERDALLQRFSALPADEFPQTRRYAAELTSGTGHERFDFTLDLILGNLAERRHTGSKRSAP